MTDSEIQTLINLLQQATALGRLSQAEIKIAIEHIIALGYVIEVP